MEGMGHNYTKNCLLSIQNSNLTGNSVFLFALSGNKEQSWHIGEELEGCRGDENGKTLG